MSTITVLGELHALIDEEIDFLNAGFVENAPLDHAAMKTWAAINVILETSVMVQSKESSGE